MTGSGWALACKVSATGQAPRYRCWPPLGFAKTVSPANTGDGPPFQNGICRLAAWKHAAVINTTPNGRSNLAVRPFITFRARSVAAEPGPFHYVHAQPLSGDAKIVVIDQDEALVFRQRQAFQLFRVSRHCAFQR